MKNKIDISIIMPAYNTSKYISKAIDSVCSQSSVNIELIVINDGSTDDTLKIIKEKMLQYKNIVLIDQKNSGLSYARKMGLNIAKGKYVYFVDSDDYLLDGSLKFMYDEVSKNDLDCLMINAKYQNELNNEYGIKMDGKNVVSKISNTDIITGESLLLSMVKKREWRYAVWLYFIKKDLLNNVSFFKDYIHEDSAFNYQLLNNSMRVKFIDKIVYVYRLRENSLMSAKSSIKNILGYINSYSIIFYRNNKKKINYNELLFELRILDQIIEVYDELDDNDKVLAKSEFEKIKPLIEKRNCYYVDKYREFFEISKYGINKDEVHNYIDYLEIDIVDHCNLNCNDCIHYSQIAKPNFMSIDTFEKDIKKLSNIVDKKLKSLVLMGGEPLLNKDICEFIKIARNYLPYTQIQILSNGILINSMSEHFWQLCRENKIQLNISTYPINLDYCEVFNKILDNGVDLFIYDNGTRENKEFDLYTYDETKSQNKDENFKICIMSKTCANLKNGKIYPCPIVNNIGRYNEYYSKNLEVTKDDYVDIYNVKDAKEIYEFLAKPVPFCSYCDLKSKTKVKWKNFKDKDM